MILQIIYTLILLLIFNALTFFFIERFYYGDSEYEIQQGLVRSSYWVGFAILGLITYHIWS